MSYFRSRISEIFRNSNYVTEFDRLLNFSTEKVRKLLDLLASTKGNSSTTIVFVKMRQTAIILADIVLNASHNRYIHVNPDFAVGQNSSNMFRAGPLPSAESLKLAEAERKKLNKTLEHFRSGKTNCIVATNVLEEGIDVRSCNLVVRFDKIPEFRSYVQSKGRARAKPSKFIIMCPRSEEADAYRSEIQQYRALEKMEVESCHGDKLNENEVPSEIEEYLTDPTDLEDSPRVTSLTAISLVSRYVQSLPCDRFTKLAPFFTFTKNEASGQFALMKGKKMRRRPLVGLSLYIQKCPLKNWFFLQSTLP